MEDTTRKPLLLNESIKETNDPPSQYDSVVGEKDTATASPGGNELSPSLRKTKRRYTILQVCSGIGLLIALVVAFALPPLIQKAIVDLAKEKVIMTSENEGQWAHFPGDTGTIIIRNFTFFKFENEDGFLFRNEKPVFREISNYKIQ
jgi:hypothetical protein